MGNIFDQYEFVERLTLKNGGKWDLWTSYNILVEQFATDLKLKALRPEQLPAVYSQLDETQLTVKKEQKVSFFPQIPFPGGLRFPHLHIEGRIYPLTRDQWKEFTVKVIEDLVDRLHNAGTVPFNGLMEISETIRAFC